MSYKVFQIQNSQGQNIGKNKYYNTLRNAKNAAHNCVWRLDDGSKIVELEVNEVPLSEIKILTKQVPGWSPGSLNTELVGFEKETKDLKKEKSDTSEFIKFN